LAQIDKIVNNYLDKLHDARLKDHERVPGVAVAVRWNKKIVHLNCYGYANLETGAKITPDTVFDLGSLSKQFTAVAVLDLVKRKAARHKRSSLEVLQRIPTLPP
jgi:CubicO group peptidase (beta-lactamase class C family)